MAASLTRQFRDQIGRIRVAALFISSIANPMRRDERLSNVRVRAQRSLYPSDVERATVMVEALDTLPDLCQLMVLLGHKPVP
jgi:hypothetical protein